MKSPIQAQAIDAATTSAASGAPGAATYLSLNIHLRRVGTAPGAYSLQLAGAAQSDKTLLPAGADQAHLERLLWAGARPVQGASRRGVADLQMMGTLPTAEAAQEVGRQLHALLFAPPLNGLLQPPLRSIDRQRGHGLRFVIDATEAPALARLPWEFTFDPRRNDFLFTDTMKPLVRWLDVDETTPTLHTEPPLRLLIAVASPKDRPALAVGEELAHLDAALSELTAQGLLRTERLEHTSLLRLEEALLRSRPHVLHFVGHGDFSGDQGTVLFESDDSECLATPVTGQRLAVLLRAHLTSLRLLFLNSCMGAAASVHNPFGGVAQALVGHGVPAVIAMQFPIPDASAVALARHFYRYLAAGRPVDEALTAARAFLYAQGQEVEWGAPVLTMRAPDGRLFDFPAQAVPNPSPKVEPTDPAVLPQAVEPAPRPGLTEQNAYPSRVDRPSPTASPPRRIARAAGLLALAGVVVALAYAGFWYMRAAETAQVAAVEAPAPSASVSPDEALKAFVEALTQANASRMAGNRAVAITSLGAAAERLKEVPNEVDIQPLLLGLRAELLLLAEGASADEMQRLFEVALTVADSRRPGSAQLLAELRAANRGTGVGSGRIDVTGSRPRATHTVRAGETLWSIAALRYGDARRWPAIALANADVLKHPDAIQPGQRLRVPPDPSTEEETTYRVRQGDSLSRIAARLYGDGNLWQRIHRANTEQITDPHRLRAGQELVIPAAP